jgi:hypothetical protein
LVPTAALSFTLALADQGLARSGRDFAAEIARPLIVKGEKVYFIGHWGLQHYMEKEGAEPFDYKRTRLVPGDWLCVSLNNTGTPPLPPELSANMETRLLRPIENPYGLSTMDAQRGTAGFYSSLFSPLPFSYSPKSTYDTWVVQRFRGTH